MPLRILSGLLALFLAATACGGSSSTQIDVAEPTTTTTTVDDEATTTAAPPADNDAINGGKPVVEVPEGDAPVELEIIDLIDGTGKVAASGDFLSMHYVGVFHADGEQFDASWDRGATFDFRLGQQQVIQGWDDGIVGMAEGGRRLLSIPSEQAYGSSERGGIPADSALVFVVDLVSVLSPPTVVNAPEPVTELEVTVVDAGDGAQIVSGDILEMHYVAMAQTTGEIFDSSWDRGQAIQLQIGTGQGLAAWDEGIIGKNVGDTVRLVIPEIEGVDPTIDGSTIITEVTIVSVLG